MQTHFVVFSREKDIFDSEHRLTTILGIAHDLASALQIGKSYADHWTSPTNEGEARLDPEHDAFRHLGGKDRWYLLYGARHSYPFIAIESFESEVGVGDPG